jgi:hypothetical protein
MNEFESACSVNDFIRLFGEVDNERLFERVITFGLFDFFSKISDVVILEELSTSCDIRILGAIAKNPNCTIEILENLSFGCDKEFILESILFNRNCSEDLFKKFVYSEFNYLALSSPYCPISILEEFSEHAHMGESIASNPSCPAELLRKLALVDDFDTRMNLVYNPNCPTDVLEGFVQRYIDDVSSIEIDIVEYAIWNVNCSTEFLENINMTIPEVKLCALNELKRRREDEQREDY